MKLYNHEEKYTVNVFRVSHVYEKHYLYLKTPETYLFSNFKEHL